MHFVSLLIFSTLERKWKFVRSSKNMRKLKIDDKLIHRKLSICPCNIWCCIKFNIRYQINIYYYSRIRILNIHPENSNEFLKNVLLEWLKFQWLSRNTSNHIICKSIFCRRNHYLLALTKELKHEPSYVLELLKYHQRQYTVFFYISKMKLEVFCFNEQTFPVCILTLCKSNRKQSHFSLWRNPIYTISL